LWLVGAGETAHKLALPVADLEGHGVCRGGQIVVDDRTVGRVGRRWLIGRERRVSVGVALNAIRRRTCEQVREVGASVLSLAQWRNIVENPKRPPVRGH